ncbi:hypothetical protein [Demequina sp. NBRC 110056]|uniref:hypothetical protein n=1 Tax=Demequina sp. NBRC 110056 TaxID=1570345 RepID=UPI0009FDDEC0|nr:hypothetical protein [Demequina sp. NBRC 110056]
MRSAHVAAAVAGVCAALAGCQGTGDEDAQGGFGVPIQPSADAVAGDRQQISGTVTVRANGCVDLAVEGEADSRWVVWPPETPAADGGAMPELDGVAVADGDTVVGTGALVDAEALPDWERDGYFTAFGGFCEAQERGVVVLDDAHLG